MATTSEETPEFFSCCCCNGSTVDPSPLQSSGAKIRRPAAGRGRCPVLVLGRRWPLSSSSDERCRGSAGVRDPSGALPRGGAVEGGRVRRDPVGQRSTGAEGRDREERRLRRRSLLSSLRQDRRRSHRGRRSFFYVSKSRNIVHLYSANFQNMKACL